MGCRDFVLAVHMGLGWAELVEVVGELAVVQDLVDHRCCTSTTPDVVTRVRLVVVSVR